MMLEEHGNGNVSDPTRGRQWVGGAGKKINNRQGRRHQGKDGNRARETAETFKGDSAIPDLEGY